MTSRARTPHSLLVFATILFAGCSQSPAPFAKADRTPKSDHEAKFDPPATYPGWAYDQPSYVKPVAELKPAPKARPSDPQHFFTKEKLVMVRQPSGYEPEEIPRVAVWWTNNNGFHWHKAGYFGREQSYFPFEAEEDGDYGIRFVGPGQEQAVQATAHPERVYHVDTVMPEVEVKIDPEQAWYNVGETITIAWRAEDYHLLETPVTVSALMDFASREQRPIEIQKGLAAEGSITYEIPPDFLDHEIQIRVDALDRADNLGIAYSHKLQIVTETRNPKLDTAAPDSAASLRHAKPPGAAPPARTADSTLPAASLDPVEAVGQMFSALGNDASIAQPSEAEASKSSAAHAGETHATTEVADAPFNPAKLLPFATVFARKTGLDGQASSLTAKPKHDAKAADASPPDELREDATISDTHSRKRSSIRPAASEESRVDLTCGNGLMIPMPGTVPPEERPSRWALAHPWRTLRRAIDEVIQVVWAMPPTRPGVDSIGDIDGRFLADYPQLRDVLEPTPALGIVVSLPENPADAAPGVP